GREYVAFDWLADATGFDFAAVSGNDRHEMGSAFRLADGLQLRAQSPLPADWKLIRNGKVVAEATGPTLECGVTQPGRDRVEVWLTIAGEKMIWILSNPVYVRAATVVCLVPSVVGRAGTDDVGPLLHTIRAVGPEGRGNREAARAWKGLAEAS